MSKKKKLIKKSRPLRDFDIVAHVVSLQPSKEFCWDGNAYQFLAMYINRYGLKIGALVMDSESGSIHSWDSYIWEEYLFSTEKGDTPDGE
jgi:hypothetical protein